MKRLEGSNLWVRPDSNGKIRYYWRARGRVFENGSWQDSDERHALGSNLERARALARQYDKAWEAKLKGEKAQRDMSLEEFIGWYVGHVRDERKLYGWKTTVISLNWFLRQVGDKPLRGITRYDVETFIAVRRQAVRPTTIKSNLRDVKRMLTVAVERGYLDVNPALTVKLGPAKPLPVKLPSAEEVARLVLYLKAKEPDLYVLAVVLIGTGCRLGEALALDWADVDLARGTLVLRRRKVQDALAMELVGPLKDALWELWTALSMPMQGLMFAGKKGTRLSRHTTCGAFKRAAVAVGLPWLTLKTFRKLAATHVAESTGDTRVAQQLLGHASLQTTELYLGRGQKARTKGLETMAGFLDGVMGSPSGLTDKAEKNVQGEVTKEK